MQFLNLMSIIAQRAGRVAIRVGGNSQEIASLVPSLPDGKAIEKDKSTSLDPVSARRMFPRGTMARNSAKLISNLRHKRQR